MIPEINGDFLQWLRGFYYTVQEASVSRAAAVMGRGQSSVSHQIACLERELAVQLFDRSQGGMRLTVEGEKLLSRAIEIFETMQALRVDLAPSLKGLEGDISIATTHAVLLYFLPPFQVSFRKRHPRVNFGLYGGGLDFILQSVESARADFGIASLLSAPKGLLFEPLFMTQPMLISPLGNPWKLKNNPGLKSIARCPFISFPDSSTIAQAIRERFMAKGLTLNTVQVLNNFELVKKYVELGLGVAILDEYALDASDSTRLCIFELDKHFQQRTYGLITRRRGYAPPAAASFMQAIKMPP